MESSRDGPDIFYTQCHLEHEQLRANCIIIQRPLLMKAPSVQNARPQVDNVTA